MRYIYTIHHNNKAVYHGINAADAMDIIIAYQGQGGTLDVQRRGWPDVQPDITSLTAY